MKKLYILAFSFLFTVSSFAGGSKAPAPVSTFVGEYSQLLEGDTLRLQDGVEMPCPESLLVRSQEDCVVAGCGIEDVTTYDGVTRQQLPFLFDDINAGKLRSNSNFSESFTTKSRLVYEEGYRALRDGGYAPGHPDRPGSPSIPVMDDFVTFGYQLKIKSDYLELSTYKYGSACRYQL